MSLESLLAAAADNPDSTVAGLKMRADELKKEKRALQKSLRNAQRRTKRIKEKAKLLSDSDLMSVIRMRQEKKEANKTKAADASGEHAAESPPAVDEGRMLEDD